MAQHKLTESLQNQAKQCNNKKNFSLLCNALPHHTYVMQASPVLATCMHTKYKNKLMQKAAFPVLRMPGKRKNTMTGKKNITQ